MPYFIKLKIMKECGAKQMWQSLMHILWSFRLIAAEYFSAFGTVICLTCTVVHMLLPLAF